MENNRKVKIERLLERLYKELESSACYAGVDPLWKLAREFNPKVTRTHVENYLSKQRTYTIHRRAVRKFERLMTEAPGPNTVWQADLGVLQMLASRNRGFAYYLLCIDCFTRMIYIEPLKKKTADSVIEAFRCIFERANSLPWKIISDQGKEFVAKSVQQFFRRRQIQHYCNYTSPIFHAGMAERANRTLKERLYRYFSEKQTKKWVDIIQPLVASINASPNRSIGGLAPDHAHLFTRQLRRYFQRIYERKTESVNKKAPPLKIGQPVRVERSKDIFQKGYKPTFSDEIFTIFRVRPTAPTTYGLVNSEGERIKGWFYREDVCPVFTAVATTKSNQNKRKWEVARIVARKMVDFTQEGPTEMLRVKWKDLGPEFDSWIPAHAIEKDDE
jgi:transposase InsO family protein